MERRALLLMLLLSSTAGGAPLFSFARSSLAQTPPPPPPPSYTPEQLDQMLAPIALYPDSLLSQVLMAATYPLEVVEAARWSKANPYLKGDAAVAGVKDKDWDVSVKSLVAFPSVLGEMNDHLDWTQKLGDAMLSQQADVADSIQRLRAKAAAAGNLNSGPQQSVTAQGSGDSVQYVIAPTDPQVVYVPSYNPSWAYGPWPYPAYPPFYYPLAGALATGFFWGIGFAAAGALFGGWNWGGHGNSYVNVNVNRAVNIDNRFNRTNIGNDGRWQHDVAHRKGVGYRNPAMATKYNQVRPGADQRAQFRGRVEQPGGGPQIANRAQPGGGAQLGNRAQPGGGAQLGNRAQPGGGAQLGNRTLPQQRPEVANRSQPAQRPSAVSGVNRGQQVNRESMRGQQQMNRVQARPSAPAGGGGARGGGGGGGGARGGGGRR